MISNMVMIPFTGESSSNQQRLVKLAFQDMYTVLDFVGEGTFGKVFKVSTLLDGDYVALKILKSEFLPNREERRRFEDEFMLLSQVNHKNIVRVYHFGTISNYGFSYFTMDWVQGGSLAGALSRHGPFGSSDVRGILGQLLTALGHLWTKQIVHRDLKPDNVLIDDSKNVYLISDFGLAKILEPNPSTEFDSPYWAGTVPYMAPEQFQNAGQVDIRADIYSLGIVGIEILTGSLPEFVLNQYNPIAARYSVDLAELENRLRQFAPSCSLPEVLCKAVAPNPNDRWEDPVEMKHGLWK